jgi:hypothetical protein
MKSKISIGLRKMFANISLDALFQRREIRIVPGIPQPVHAGLRMVLILIPN